jgi:hypothetical protein
LNPSPSVEASPSPEATASAGASASPAASPSLSPRELKKQVRENVQAKLKNLRAALVRAKWFKWKFVWGHAKGIAVTQDNSEYHAFSLHGRVIRFIPDDKIQELKAQAAAGSAPCQSESCLDEYGVEKAIGVMRFGAVNAAQGEKYWFVGSWDANAKTLTADVFTAPYSFACLSGDPNCTATKIGSVTATVHSDYEGYKHLVVGSVSFTGGAYAGKSFNLYAIGWANPRAIQVQTQAQLVNA